MASIIEQYNNIYKKTKNIREQIATAESRIAEIRSGGESDIAERIEYLEEQIKKIDDYSLKIKALQEVAKKNLDSQNVLTIEAPPNYRVNINRLKDWAMMIDPMSSNDPYAQRVLAVAKCDELFLEKKKGEFTERIKELTEDRASGLTHEMVELEKKIQVLMEELNSLILDDEFKIFSNSVIAENSSFWFENAPKTHGESGVKEYYSIGSHSVPLVAEGDDNTYLKEQLKQFYDPIRGNVLIPLTIPANKEFVISIMCSPSKTKQVDRGLQNFLLQQIDCCDIGSRKIYVFDAVRYNSNSIGGLKQLENTFALNQIPRNPEQLTSALEQLTSAFIEVDEVIDTNDSIREYNEQPDIEKTIPYTTMVLFGWPNSFGSRDKELVNRMLSNYERYGVSIVTVNYQTADQELDIKKILPEYALYNSIQIKAMQKRTTVLLPDADTETLFAWYPLNEPISESYVSSVKEKTPTSNLLGNDYTERYDMNKAPTYSRDIKPIVLPFGVDGKDVEQSITFDKNNFAAYLIGDSGSGKSTLIHTIIAGILRNYHPDNVELWLADFKQVEFKQYINHMPPHVKYILLDESHELVYDLIDKLNDEMLSRQQLLARLGKEKVDEIDVREYGKAIPMIFVILDEFSIMSQAIEEDQSYRLKLQNLLAKGRALGFKFLFASQKFTSGVAGLTPTAKDQIQQRISMKAPKDEINEVLALSPALKTEKVINWVDTLPPYYALVKRRIDDDTLEVARMKVMFFSDNYESRDKMIDTINSAMERKNQFEYDNVLSYVDKTPVIVDGNSYEAFDIDFQKSKFEELKRYEYHDDNDVYMSLGTPRLMTSAKFLTLSPESRENILLVAKSAEQSCAASILLSVIKMCRNQNRRVTIWTYSKNPLFRQFGEAFKNEGCQVLSTMNEICLSIKQIKEKIRNGENGSEIIVMLGMDRIYGDFEYNTGEVKNHSAKNGGFANTISSPEEEEAVFKHNLDNSIREKRSEIVKKMRGEGASDDEIKVAVSDMANKMREEAYAKRPLREVIEPQVVSTIQDNEDLQEDNSYNAADDYVEIIKMGSRLGYHFIACLNSAADVKAMGLKVDFFRHRLAFQLSEDDSYTLFGKKVATGLPEHTCLYDDSFSRYSLKPYLHKEINWDGWSVDEYGKAKSPLE